MQQITPATVLPLIESESQNGRTLDFVFACPATGRRLSASCALPAKGPLTATVSGRTKRAALVSIRGPLAAAIRQLFGSGNALARMLGDVASSTAYAATSPLGNSSPHSITKAEREGAALTAFRDVAQHFEWDPSRDGWIARATPTSDTAVSDWRAGASAAPIA